MRAEVIAIGDELTTGQRLDTNSQWLSERLTALGIDVAFHTTVGDDLEDNVTTLRAAIERIDVVVITGGLGPTADDLTRDAVAAATDTKLVRDEASLEHIRQMFIRRGRDMPERNQVQADFPAGSQPIANLNGTAPGIEMRIERAGQPPCLLFALPGVPVEMHEMWEATVRSAIEAARPEPRTTIHHRIKCFGVGESHLEAMLPDLIRRGRQPTVGITVSDATITLRITASGKDEATCQALVEPVEATIREALGDLVFGTDDEELEHAVVRLLRERGLTVAVSEWASAGLVNTWLSTAANGKNPYLGGDQIDESTWRSVAKSNAFAESAPHESATATLLAENIRRKMHADFGLGIAAFPPDRQEPGAHVCVSLVTPNKTRRLRFPCGAHPAILESRTAKQALNALRLTLLKE